MRSLYQLLPILLLFHATGAGATLIDNDPLNNTPSPLLDDIFRGSVLTFDAGTFSLTPGDLDYVGVFSVKPEDVITAVTTPLDSPGLSVPDTVLALFDSAGTQLDFNDDANGVGSLIRFRAMEAGDYFVGVSGCCDDNFTGNHGESGRYVLSISIAPIPEPAPLLLVSLGLALLGFAGRRRPKSGGPGPG